MARPDYLICLECESEVEDFIWREGEIRRATCEVCGNSDADAFSLPEEFEQDMDEEIEEEEEEEDEEPKYLDDYEEDEEDEEEE
jgi:Zn ribbon nucleic-acid-binding protein